MSGRRSGRHKGGSHEGGSEERWLLTYADLITLLLAFFIIMYSTSKADLEKFGQLAKSFQATFGFVGFEGGDGVLNSSSGLFDFGALGPEQRQFMMMSEKLQSFATSQGLQGKIAVNRRDQGIAVTLSNALLFPSGGVQLSEDAKVALAKIAELIRPLPNELRIEAHTDDVPTDSATYPTNWDLSAARAVAVARYLIEAEGIEAGNLSVLGYGEHRPLYPNDTREHRALNRRADILILYPAARPAPSVDFAQQ
jgi:chemotaxis protein MotB